MATKAKIVLISISIYAVLCSHALANGTISGTLTDANNNPLSNMSISLQGGGIDSYPRYNLTTSPLGQFSVSVKPGVYYMSIWSYNTSNWYARYYYENLTDMNATQTPIPVAEGQTVNLSPKLTVVGGKVSGKVLDSNGKPVVGASVYVYPSSDYMRYSHTTDINGVFTTRAYPPGTTFQANTYDAGGKSFYYDGNGGTSDYSKRASFTVTAGQTTTGIDFKLPKAITNNKVVVVPLGN